MTEILLSCRYSCPLCGLLDVAFDAPARGDEDVLVWMKQTFEPALFGDHQKRSPGCSPASLKDVKIPISGADRIGGPSLA